ncbi:MAG: glucose-6-phosphate isomerase [Pseudomonadota bacterium]
MADLSHHKERLLAANLREIARSRDGVAFVEAAGWTANLARHRLDQEAQSVLLRIAHEADLAGAISRLFSGAHVNPSEDRPALHWAMRGDESLAGEPAEVRDTLASGDAFADSIYNKDGAVLAANGQPFRNVVHIGIGGSDFGPRLLADAFELERNRDITLRFCANVDPLDLDLALDGLDPTETLVIGVSKSFGTEETLYNLTRAKAWLEATLGTDGTAAKHLALVTSRGDRAREWLNGAEPYLFDMPASVGGRFSIWSNASLACRILLGPDIINAVRKGARDMDAHMQTAPLGENMPARLALLDYWNRTVLGYPMRVQLAYARRLRMLPTYLQQLEMESNGKSVRPDGTPIPHATAPALWGGEGSIGQHSYHQWLHQGTDGVPAEFILATEARGDANGRVALTAHALAQAEVLANGRDLSTINLEEPNLTDAVAAQKVHVGGRPSSFLFTDTFGAEAFGSLIALFEHRTYLAGVLWGVNSFDQWGVEAGKTMAGKLKVAIAGDGKSDDEVTSNLIAKFYS